MEEISLKYEYDKCPVCGKNRGSNSKCPKCGFEYIPIDVEKDTDIPIVLNARKNRKKWYNSLTFQIIICVLVCTLSSYLIAMLLNSDNYLPTFVGVDIIGILTFSIIITLLLFLIGIVRALSNTEATFKNERKQIIDKVNAEAKKAEEKIREQKRLEEQRQYEKEVKLAIQKRKEELIEKYGQIERTIILNKFRTEYDLSKDIIVYGESKHIIIEGVHYNFSDLLSCELKDDKIVTKGKTYTTTDLTPGTRRLVALDNLAGRPDWAAADAASGRRISVTHKEPDKVTHQYNVYINTNSISKPVVKLCFSYNESLAREVNGLINAVISQGNKSEN